MRETQVLKRAAKSQRGFTLVEVAIVGVILLILLAALLQGYLKSRDDAKLNSAVIQLEKNFPTAIMTQVARTMGCSSSTITKQLLIDRGLPDLTPWNTSWTISSVTSNTVTISYPLDTSDAKAATDLVNALSKSNNVASAAATGNSSVTVGYHCN